MGSTGFRFALTEPTRAGTRQFAAFVDAGQRLLQRTSTRQTGLVREFVDDFARVAFQETIREDDDPRP